MTTVDAAESSVEQQRREMVAMARDFARTEIAPHAAEWDRKKEYPADTVKRLGALGFLGMLISEELDGLGLDTLTYVMMIEEIAAADASVSITLSVHNSLPSSILQAWGTPQQWERWLKPMARGELLAAFCVSEAGSGSDVASLDSRAVRNGTDWVLNGTKAWVTNGDVADLLLVLVRTSDDATSRTRGLSFFMVPADTPGVEPTKPEDKMGLRASRTTQVVLTDVCLHADHLIGEDGAGFQYAMEGLEGGRLGVAAQAVGIAQAALDHSIRYAAEREQFEVPIKDFQGIGFKLADMATRVAAARALLHDVARAKERGEDVSMRASMAKLFASEAAMFVTTEAVQVFGGYGYMRDYPVERLFRDAKVTEIYEGTSEVQRIIISRGLYAHDK
ncbi:MAG: acyl-CoA dehydrogenase family protein [Gemmatimonadetes bacterium]|nr:acyl-CoA dehydrogenase family protein [Gemmatimonadota bacterium]